MKSIYFFKKILVLVMASLLMQLTIKAQYVTIPDANFVTYLQANFPSAMSGNQMNTQDPNVLAATFVSVANLGITDLSGIEYFLSMQVLECQNNLLGTLPTLPAGLSELYCGNNPIASLPALPSSLLILSCPVIMIPSLPTLPSTLRELYCGGNFFTSIPALPSGLLWLDCQQNSLSNLPQLPIGLLTLNCSNNLLSCLPPLPNSMQQLIAINNSVTCLPNIPTNGGFTSDIGTALCNGIASNFNGTPISCYGACDGDLILTSTPGVPLDYVWSTGFNDLNNSSGVSGITSLCAGGYSVTITPSSGGCSSYMATSLSQPSQQQLGQPTIDPITCNGDSTWVYFPGNPPYNFQWSTGAVADSVYIPAGTYTVSVIGGGPCGVLPATFTVQPFITVAIPLNAGYCSGSSGQVCVTAIGGTAPYTYQWNGTPIPSNCGPVNQPINYDVFVTDANGCTGFSSFTPTVFPAPSFSSIITNAIVCNANPVILCIPTVTGGTLPYFYQWSNGAATFCTALTVGTYTYTVVDANGCSVSSSTSVTYSPGWVGMDLTNITLPTCGACDGQATVSVSGGNPIASYTWMPGGITVPTNNFICDNTDSYVVVTDTAGCVDTLNFSLSCHAVWPGDANNDGVANNVDLLAIGIGYGTTDIARPNATINWQAEIGLDWVDSLANGTNYKHIDCNGDGIIASDDTVAILQNFGLSHPLRKGAVINNITDPPLYFDLIIDTVGTSQQMDIPLMLGTSTLPMDSIYGIAFTVNYDTSLVKADSVSMLFPYCWLGSYGTDAISIYKNDPLNGKLYAAITRINHTDTSGFGELARLTIVTTDNVSGRLMQPVFDTLSFDISDVTANNFTQEIRPVSVLNDSLIIEDVTAIDDLHVLSKIIFYPNPVKDVLKMILPQQVQLFKIEIADMLGKNISGLYSQNGNEVTLQLNDKANGLYDVRITTDFGVLVKKVSVMNK